MPHLLRSLFRDKRRSGGRGKGEEIPVGLLVDRASFRYLKTQSGRQGRFEEENQTILMGWARASVKPARGSLGKKRLVTQKQLA